MPSGVYERTEEMKRKTSEGVKRLWKNEEYVLSKGKDILWLWEHEINDEWFDIADYLEVM